MSKSYLIFEILPVTGIMVSFKNVFGKSKLWQLTHSTFQALDERETELVYRATTISYSIFAIVTLILIYLFYLGGLGAIDVVLAAFLLYLAHTLPAAIIAWNQKVVIDED
ncbi:MAG: hypothetical protein K9N06_13425 [Candidatus Cloacimonetes bacterium]|nr:hypothetical protein [Candidatus Cloacimonadota bacterium]